MKTPEEIFDEYAEKNNDWPIHNRELLWPYLNIIELMKLAQAEQCERDSNIALELIKEVEENPTKFPRGTEGKWHDEGLKRGAEIISKSIREQD